MAVNHKDASIYYKSICYLHYTALMVLSVNCFLIVSLSRRQSLRRSDARSVQRFSAGHAIVFANDHSRQHRSSLRKHKRRKEKDMGLMLFNSLHLLTRLSNSLADAPFALLPTRLPTQVANDTIALAHTPPPSQYADTSGRASPNQLHTDRGLPARPPVRIPAHAAS